MRASAARVALAVTALALLSGCGGGGRSADGRRNCKVGSVARYAAGIVTRYYEQGQLGSEATVAKELERDEAPGFGDTFFDDSGHVMAYAKLNHLQQAQFNNWMYNDQRIDEITSVHSKIDLALPRLTTECR